MRFCLKDGNLLTSSIDPEATLVINDNQVLNITTSTVQFGRKDIFQEALNVLAPELFRIYCLFGYETDVAMSGTRDKSVNDFWGRLPIHSPLSSNFLDTDLQERFEAWVQTKRYFFVDEIVRDKWRVEYVEHNFRDKYPMIFHSNGKFVGNPIDQSRAGDDYTPSEDGDWELKNGILQIYMGYDVECDIIASRGGQHSGIYHANNLMYRYVLFRRER